MKVVSWNVRGQYTLLHLAARMVANGWDVLIVLEPSSKIKSGSVTSGVDKLLGTHKVGHRTCNVGGESIVVLYRTDRFSSFEAISLQTHQDYSLLQQQSSGKNAVFHASVRKPILIVCKATDGSVYRIMSAHAPFWNNEGIAASYQQGLQELAEKLGVDVIMGDLNTYGSGGRASRSSMRKQYDFEVVTTTATSKGGACLDKVLLNKRLRTMMHHFFSSADRTVVKDPKDVESAMTGNKEAEELLKGAGSRSSDRPSVRQSAYGRGLTKKLDHDPVELTLPPLLSKQIRKVLAGRTGKGRIEQYLIKRKLAPSDRRVVDIRQRIKPKLLDKHLKYERIEKKRHAERLKRYQALRSTAGSERDALLKRGQTLIAGDGNCLYRSLAYLLYGNQNQHADVRHALAGYLLDNFHDFHFLDFLSTPEQALPYFDELLTDGAWGGEFEVFLASLCFGVTIHLHSEDGYDQAEYNPGQQAGIDLYHEDYHFFVLPE